MSKTKSKLKPKTQTIPKNKSRVRKIPTHRTFKLTTKRFRHPGRIPNPMELFKRTLRLMWGNKLLFGGIVLSQSLITILFIQGVTGMNEISDLKQNIRDLLGESGGAGEKAATGFALFGYLASSSNKTSSDVAGIYQLTIAIIVSLATIWAVRQLLAGEKPSLKDVFYRGMYPLIPFIFVLLVIGVQLIPALIGNMLYSTVLTNGLATTPIEQVLWFMIFILLLLLSAYMLASSLFALYIVTLPDMTPLKALRSARQLVLHRRVSVLLRIVSLPLIMLSFALIVFVPLIIIATVIAQPLFIIFSSFAFLVTHTYMYFLYRSLL